MSPATLYPACARCARTRKSRGRAGVSLGKCPDAGEANCATKTSYSRWTDHSIHLCFKTPHATFTARGSSVTCPLSWASRERDIPARPTCDLTVHASPLQDIAPSRSSAGSSAYAALLCPITCTSPSARQPIRGVTPGLCFLRNPSRHAMRLAPAHVDA